MPNSKRQTSRPSDVPAALWGAIVKAASTYGVPAATLAGIWRIESGSTYPNPAVNKLGYGGLLGTTDWNGSTQSQANLSASILARLLRQNKGNMARALSEYSGGGYTSVPGGGNPSSGGPGGDVINQSSQAAAQSTRTAQAPPARPRQHVGPQIPTGPLPAEGSSDFGPQTSQNQEGAFGLTPYQVADVWSQMAGQQFASPETRQLANNASDLVDNVPDLLQGP